MAEKKNRLKISWYSPKTGSCEISGKILMTCVRQELKILTPFNIGKHEKKDRFLC